MELFFNCNQNDVKNEYGFIAISVGQKTRYLNKQICNLLIEYIIKYHHKDIVILICDEISSYNLQAFNNYNAIKANIIASQLGNIIFDNIKESIEFYKINNTFF